MKEMRNMKIGEVLSFIAPVGWPFPGAGKLSPWVIY